MKIAIVAEQFQITLVGSAHRCATGPNIKTVAECLTINNFEEWIQIFFELVTIPFSKPLSEFIVPNFDGVWHNPWFNTVTTSVHSICELQHFKLALLREIIEICVVREEEYR